MPGPLGISSTVRVRTGPPVPLLIHWDHDLDSHQSGILIMTNSHRHIGAVTGCRYPHLLQPDDGLRSRAVGMSGSYRVVCDGQRNYFGGCLRIRNSDKEVVAADR